MNKEERLELENELLMTCSKAQAINKYIDELEENQQLKERIDKAIEFSNKNWGTWCTHHLEYMTELQNILKEET